MIHSDVIAAHQGSEARLVVLRTSQLVGHKQALEELGRACVLQLVERRQGRRCGGRGGRCALSNWMGGRAEQAAASAAAASGGGGVVLGATPDPRPPALPASHPRRCPAPAPAGGGRASLRSRESEHGQVQVTDLAHQADSAAAAPGI